MSFFSTSNILVHIPLGAGGYDLSWIEAIGTLFGLLCIWYASKENTTSTLTLYRQLFNHLDLSAFNPSELLDLAALSAEQA
ncbi:hypothetical protein ACJ8PQ_23995, partial [Serratia sp. CY74664]